LDHPQLEKVSTVNRLLENPTIMQDPSIYLAQQLHTNHATLQQYPITNT